IESDVNNIVIYLSHADDARNQEFIENAKKLTPPPIIEYPEDNKKEVKFNSFNSPTLMPRQQNYLRILGGDGITTFNTICSAGFWVRSAGREFLATAGHCALNDNVEFYNLPSDGENPTLIGQIIIRETSGFDRGYIMKTNSKVLASPIIRDTVDEEFPELQIMAVTDPDTEGMVVCKSGYNTLVTCGRISGIFDSFTRPRDGKVINNFVMADMECRGGDSGSPVYVYLDELLPTIMIVGMVFGAGDDFCLIHPVNAILFPGMEVITI
ncbi:22164_t:CDS:1, partial [Gigaspora rosea]